jgi:hypothetical protein
VQRTCIPTPDTRDSSTYHAQLQFHVFSNHGFDGTVSIDGVGHRRVALCSRGRELRNACPDGFILENAVLCLEPDDGIVEGLVPLPQVIDFGIDVVGFL